MKNWIIIDFKYKKAMQMFGVLPSASLTSLFVVTEQRHNHKVRVLYTNAWHAQKL